MTDDTFKGQPVKNGRPFLFTDPNKLKNIIQTYFDDCDPHLETQMVESGITQKGKSIFEERQVLTKQKPYTITGLALALGVARQTLLNYQNPEHWSDTIDPEVRQDLLVTVQEARQRVEEFNEQSLFKSGVANGVKFNLTNNFGWVDKQVIDQNTRSVENDLDDLDESKDEVADAARSEAQK